MCAASESKAKLFDINPTITSIIKYINVIVKTIFNDLLCLLPADVVVSVDIFILFKL